MKINIVRYLKKRLAILFLLLTLLSIFTIVGLLAHHSTESLLYTLILACFFIMIFGLYDAYGYYRTLRIINCNLKGGDSTASRWDLEGLDSDYRPLIQNLEQRYHRLKSETLSNIKDQEDYYSLWVHQIKVPIAAIDLTLQTSEHPRSFILQNELLKIRQYVDMVLNYVKLNDQVSDFVFKPFDIDLCIKTVLHKLAPLFIHKKIALVYQSQASLILSDIKWIEFILEQLLTNAIKYTNKGSITIKLEKDCLTITDTGRGIEASDLPRIFEKGYTGYNGRMDQHSSGLGLYLTKCILTKLNHSISLTSQRGCGTQVCIDFSHKPLYFD